MPSDPRLDALAVNTIRMLAADAVQQAKSGHPGMPMGMADVAYVLWTKFLSFNPKDPAWPNRDRFVLSAGHGSMLLYAMLHLCGYEVSLEDIKQFRQLGSITPGHPEFGVTPGVECTTGPLGQGFANGVGMALASRIMASKFNSLDYLLIDHYVYAICSDGDLMEGISHEAASLAGHLGLGNLIYVYDDNRITIEGKTDLAYSDDVARRFEGYGWHTDRIDGHDRAQVERAILAAQGEKEHPTLILARTHIGFGSPGKQDTAGAHGEPLGDDELLATKRNLGWPEEPRFLVPEEVREVFRQRVEYLAPIYEDWQQMLAEFREDESELAGVWDAMWSRRVPADIAAKLAAAAGDAKDATRNIGGNVIQVAAQEVPSLYGGSADLAPSTKTLLKGEADISRGQFSGRNLHFGVREHAMGSVATGMAMYGSFIPYGSTFLVFSDYMRPPIRLAALSHVQAIYVFTHDSIFVGEDGPTHEPIEHVASLRAMPNLWVYRPATGPETAAAWTAALGRAKGPTVMCLTRQSLPPLPPPADPEDLHRGAYVVVDCDGAPELVIIGTGSEAHLAVGAAQALQVEGVKVRAVSMPCWEAFEAQEEDYRRQVLPPGAARVAVEAGCSMGWERYLGRCGLFIGMDRFGASAPYQALAEHFGFTVEKVMARIREWRG